MKILKNIINNLLKLINLKLVKNDHYDKLISKASSSKDLNFLKKINSPNINMIIPFLERSEAQLCQDLFVLEKLNFKKNGFFVEFGVCDGINLSNTYLLEKEFKWNGIVCEPAKVYWKALRDNRSCIIENKCVYKISNKEIDFNETTNPKLSTINDFSISDFHKEARTKGKIYKVKTISINDLLTMHNAPKKIDYLSVDTEGSEFEILSQLDFNKYSPLIITVEHNYNDEIRKNIFDLLTNNNYERFNTKISLFDDWYYIKNLN